MRQTLVTFLLLGLMGPAAATDYLIAPDGTGDFPTIQAAIDSCADGDVIYLADGVFSGDGNRRIDVRGRQVVIRSQSGDPTTCVVDIAATPLDQHYGFQFVNGEGADTRLEGLTICNGADLGC